MPASTGGMSGGSSEGVPTSSPGAGASGSPSVEVVTPSEIITGNTNKSKTGQSSADLQITGTEYTLSSASSNRILSSRNIISNRPVLIGMFDFFPLYESEGNTPAGDLFDLRISLRSSDLDSTKEALEQVKSESEAAYTAALTQYESALASSYTEVSFLKLFYLMRKYAEQATSFSDFIVSYELPEDADLDIGSSTNPVFDQYMKLYCNLDWNYLKSWPVNFSSWQYTPSNPDSVGIIPLLWLIAKLSFNSAIVGQWRLSSLSSAMYGAPASSGHHGGTETTGAVHGPRGWESGAAIYYVINPGVDADDLGYDKTDSLPLIPWLSKILTVSAEMYKINAAISTMDESAITYFKEIMGESYLTTSKDQAGPSIFYEAFGWDPWASARRNLWYAWSSNNFWDNYIPSLLSGRGGLMGTLGDMDSGIMYTEEVCATLSRNPHGHPITYDSIKTVVDKSFEEDSLLDFTEYKTIVDNMTESCQNNGKLFKSLFRLLDKKNVQDSEIPPGWPLLEDEHPLSPASLYMRCMEVLSRRFLNRIGDSCGRSDDNGASGEARDGDETHLKYLQVMAYIYATQDEKFERLAESVLDDWQNGHLTAESIPEPYEDEDEDSATYGDTITPDTVFIDPVTGIVVDNSSTTRALNRMTNLYNRVVNGNSTISEMGGDISWISGEVSLPPTDLPAISSLGGTSGWDASNTTAYAYDVLPDDAAASLTPPAWLFEHSYDDYRQASYLFTKNTDTGSRSMQYIKTVVAEWIDAVFEVMRSIVEAIEELEIDETRGVFPYLDKCKSPYAKGNNLSWGESIYSGYGFKYWVPTIEKLIEFFCRSGDYTTLYGGFDLHMLFRQTSRIMISIIKNMIGGEGEDADFYLKYAVAGANTSGVVVDELWYCLYVFQKDGIAVNAENGWGESASEDAVNDILALSVSDILETGGSGAGGLGIALNPGREDIVGTLYDILQDEMALGVGFDIIEKYGDKIEAYSDAALSSLGGGDEETPMSIFVTALMEAGTGGQDILQNITPAQLALKTVSVERQQGNSEEGYVPMMSVITDNEIKALKTLLESTSLVGSEGENIRVFSIGLPAGFLEDMSIPLVGGSRYAFAVTANLVDIEYGDIVFRPKYFNFDKDLYILPEDFENPDRGDVPYAGFDDLFSAMQFSRIAFNVDSGDSPGAEMSVEETNEKEYPEFTVNNPGLDPFGTTCQYNILISYLLEQYYRLMVGLEINEDTFTSTGDKLGLQINDYAADLSGALSDLYSTLDSDAGDLSALFDVTENMSSSYQDLVANFSTEIEVGEFSELDAEMLGQFRNTLSSRLFSAEAMRDRILAAKIFDRVLFVMIDPDEFYIETVSSVSSESLPYTDAGILQQYIDKGVVEPVYTGAGTNYKLAPRQSSEGQMSFNKIFFSISGASEEELGEIQGFWTDSL